MFEYEYPRASLTADMVIFRKNKSRMTEVLLIERGIEPFKGRLAIVGGHMNQDESLLACAIRETKEEVDLTIDSKNVFFVGMYDAVNRDPRGRTLTAAYLTNVDRDVKVVAGDDAAAFKWVTMGDIFGKSNLLAFDHYDIICDAYEKYGNLYLGV